MGWYRNALNDRERANLDRLLALRESGHEGPVTADSEVATQDNTDPWVWQALKTPISRRRPR